MIPSILARQLQKGIGDYVATTFPMTNVPFKDSFTDMLREKDYLYHEPYVSIRLPFRSVDTMPDCFEAIQPAYMPYVHQARAFERLTGKSLSPRWWPLVQVPVRRNAFVSHPGLLL